MIEPRIEERGGEAHASAIDLGNLRILPSNKRGAYMVLVGLFADLAVNGYNIIVI